MGFFGWSDGLWYGCCYVGNGYGVDYCYGLWVTMCGVVGFILF
jgi:hypothetical protein